MIISAPTNSQPSPGPTLNFDWVSQTPMERELAVDIDFYKLFCLIRSRHEICYFFESLALPKHQDRYHVMGFDPAILFKAHGQSLDIQTTPDIMAKLSNNHYNQGHRRIDGRIDCRIDCDNPYSFLQNNFPKFCNGKPHQGGLIGYFSHEAVNYFEPSLTLPEHPDFGGFCQGLYLDGLIYDTLTNRLSYYSYGEDRSALILDYLAELQEFEPFAQFDDQNKLKLDITFQGDGLSREDFLAATAKTREKIKQGYSFQAEVGLRSNYQIKGDKLAIYHTLRQVNPSPYMYYLKFGTTELMGASPEILVCNNQGSVFTNPAAGTIARGQDEAEDIRLARQLLSDPKEISEHNMLVDLHRNDLARVCRPGSVRVADLMFLIKFSHVQHIVSTITGELDQGKDSFDLLASILPGGVTTGAPKIETIKIIHDNEKIPRGPYGGAVGRMALNGDCAFCLPIRSLFCVNETCYAQTSAGVVYDSKPDAEYQEIVNKLAAMRRVLDQLS